MEFYGILSRPVFSERRVANEVVMAELKGDRQRLDQEGASEGV